MYRRPVLLLLAVAIAVGADTPWPAPVPGHVTLTAGEHPRLFWRRSDLPALKARAARWLLGR